MQNSNKFTKRRPWIFSTLVLLISSIGGAISINAIWLNPSQNLAGAPTPVNDTKTATGDPIDYQYGVVQLEVTATKGTIDSIKEIQATASNGYVEAFPALNQMAIKAQSADFGTLSGATFASAAYAKALSSALSKLN